MVHLRLRQGVLPPAPPPSPRDARVSEEEAGPDGVKARPLTHSRFLYLCLLLDTGSCPGLAWPVLSCPVVPDIQHGTVQTFCSVSFYHFLSLESVETLIKEVPSTSPTYFVLLFLASDAAPCSVMNELAGPELDRTGPARPTNHCNVLPMLRT